MLSKDMDTLEAQAMVNLVLTDETFQTFGKMGRLPKQALGKQEKCWWSHPHLNLLEVVVENEMGILKNYIIDYFMSE